MPDFLLPLGLCFVVFPLLPCRCLFRLTPQGSCLNGGSSLFCQPNSSLLVLLSYINISPIPNRATGRLRNQECRHVKMFPAYRSHHSLLPKSGSAACVCARAVRRSARQDASTAGAAAGAAAGSAAGAAAGLGAFGLLPSLHN